MKKLIVVLVLTALLTPIGASAATLQDTHLIMERWEHEKATEALPYVIQTGFHNGLTVLELNIGIYVVVEGTIIVPKYSKIRGLGKTLYAEDQKLTVVTFIPKKDPLK